MLHSTGVHLEFDSVRGYWGNLTPALALKHVQVFLPGETIPIVSIDKVDAEIDLYRPFNTSNLNYPM